MEEPKWKSYPSGPNGIKVLDTIGIPHPYCITPKHVEVAANRFGGMLGQEAIREAEKRGAMCHICRRSGERLTYDQHETAILIGIPGTTQEKLNRTDLNTISGLHEYLLQLKPLVERDRYSGFAFKAMQR